MQFRQSERRIDGLTVDQLTSYRAWLQYREKDQEKYTKTVAPYLKAVSVTVDNDIIERALDEWTVGLNEMFKQRPAVVRETISEGLAITLDPSLPNESYQLKTTEKRIQLTAKDANGVLYGVFHLLRLLQMEESLQHLSMTEVPKNPVRMINQWDDMNGEVERGYAGESFFYKDYQFIKDRQRIYDYARLLAAAGINAISINNVNVHENETDLIFDRYLMDVKQTSDIFNQFGITLFLSINYAAPMEKGIASADPLDKDVQAFWKARAQAIYQVIPNFGGFLVKADSENRPGPFTYGRNHAEGANMLAEALEPYGGLVIWRCFVYNCKQDWRDRQTDRARAAYDHFMPLDGAFKENVVLQIKNGPMDFQVREPVSPLIGSLENTNHFLEFQIAQEYLGQQKHLVYLVPQWKEVLSFDTYSKGMGTYVKDIVAGEVFKNGHAGIVAVSNVGSDYNWTGHLFAQLNLYGYGRMIWNPELTAEAIALEWVKQTFGNDPFVIKTIMQMVMPSWEIYENYTSPLGIGWMVNISHHYGPNIDGYEYDKWGTYHFADRNGVGVDRTIETGTGFTGQFHKENARVYNDLTRCPDELLLFFHHVPYTHQLHSGKTVIQHIYDTHFRGVEQVKAMIDAWQSLKEAIDPTRYTSVMERLEHQLYMAKEWRDTVNTYFYRKSGINDLHGRTIY
ncbi:alpha-glucuronidase [Streptohalobacillus salinus]|uniref:Xylan alpha-1,2-glucuronidase n=1 Tax=Streptohalobacillus salinus TaxID=621096 RepID=A0A2V3WCV9_9BACI|nr:alpha-glucuronidase family glycosyl hydrolase [Streptohalobacillus salinus]PXW90921.1 alpha-glucuronidase [Streptohalobacillus salinus]